ncbi:MAG: hypothetical protein AAGI38_15325, partial [Bacteroidota bacterium]
KMISICSPLEMLNRYLVTGGPGLDHFGLSWNGFKLDEIEYLSLRNQIIKKDISSIKNKFPFFAHYIPDVVVFENEIDNLARSAEEWEKLITLKYSGTTPSGQFKTLQKYKIQYLSGDILEVEVLRHVTPDLWRGDYVEINADLPSLGTTPFEPSYPKLMSILGTQNTWYSAIELDVFTIIDLYGFPQKFQLLLFTRTPQKKFIFCPTFTKVLPKEDIGTLLN